MPTSRAGAKRTIITTMKELPNFLRLLGGLLTDRRVSNTDKLLVGGAIGYILLPMDFIPDYIPFLGEIEVPVDTGLAAAFFLPRRVRRRLRAIGREI